MLFERGAFLIGKLVVNVSGQPLFNLSESSR